MSIASVVQTAQAVFALVPILANAIKSVEQAFPEGGKGQEKLAMVRTVLEGAFNTYGGLVVNFETVWPILSAAITALVSAYNAAGVFKKA